MSKSLGAETSHVSKQAGSSKHYKLLINGQELESSSGEWFTHYNPRNVSEAAFSVATGSEADMDKAIAAARAEFDSGKWPNLKAYDRAQILEKACTLIAENITRLGELLHVETGRFQPFCLSEIQSSVIEVFRYNIAQALTFEGRANTSADPSSTSLSIYQPVGVVGAIVPWNFPLMLLAHKIAPALAAGCTVVVKPSLFTTPSTIELVKLLHQAGVPVGAIHVVPGTGAAGERMCQSLLVDKVTFTGSTETAKKVMASASSTMKRITLEAGGKSPLIVCKDADIGALLSMNPPLFILGAGLFHSGQVCAIGSRVLVHKSKKAELLAGLKGAFESDGIRAVVGPVTFKEQFNKISEYVSIGQKEGNVVVTGGKQRTDGDCAKGLFFEPTLIDNVSPNHTLWKEEVFGPLTAIAEFDTIDEAILLANSVEQGLSASIWSNNINDVMKLSKGVRAGYIMVNKFAAPGPHEPFGGMKQSGLGRECGRDGYAAFLEQKTVSLTC